MKKEKKTVDTVSTVSRKETEKNYLWPMMLILIGCIFLLDSLNIINDAFAKLWPLILIIIGVTIIAANYRKS